MLAEFDSIYTVQKGDTMLSVAFMFNIKIVYLQRINDLIDKNYNLVPGQKMLVHNKMDRF